MPGAVSQSSEEDQTWTSELLFCWPFSSYWNFFLFYLLCREAGWELIMLLALSMALHKAAHSSLPAFTDAVLSGRGKCCVLPLGQIHFLEGSRRFLVGRWWWLPQGSGSALGGLGRTLTTDGAQAPGSRACCCVFEVKMGDLLVGYLGQEVWFGNLIYGR